MSIYLGKTAKNIVILSVLLAAVGINLPASASPYVYVNTHSQITLDGGGYQDSVIDPFFETWASTGPLTHTSALVESDQYIFRNAQASASADYGVLRACAHASGGSGSVEINGSTVNLFTTGSASASAEFGDMLTITSPAQNGSGIITFHVHVDGTMSGSVYHPGVWAGAGWSISLDRDYYHTVDQWDYSANAGRYGGDFELSTNFIYGLPMEFSLTLVAIASAHDDNYYSASDYFNTARLTGVSITDFSGAAVSDITILSASGYNYVPEPATMCLLGLGALSILRKKKITR